MAFKSNPELDIDVRRVHDILAAANPGDVVTHQSLSAVIGRNAQNGARDVVQRAIRRQLNAGRLWVSIRKVGYKLADTAVAAALPESIRKRGRRFARREATKLATVTLEGLSAEQTTEILAAQSMLGVIGSVTKAATIKKIQERITKAQDNKALPLAKTLEVFER